MKKRRDKCSDWCVAQHRFCRTGDPLGAANPVGRFVLVGGSRPFLNVGAKGAPTYHLQGRGKLRALARAILTATRKR